LLSALHETRLSQSTSNRLREGDEAYGANRPRQESR
jgi:hypothetical protein